MKRKIPTLLKLKQISLALIALTAIFALEPLTRDKMTFAVTYFTDPSFTYEHIFKRNQQNAVAVNEPRKTQTQKTHAPEPGTFVTFLTGITAWLIRFVRKSFERFKRGFDLAFAMLGLMVSLPVIGIAALFIKLTSKGPVLYKQNRLGKDGKVFQIYKLRTMGVDAEKGTGAVWAVQNDPRVTPVGRILRKTHIDEIPQFLNVIKGDMSIVGPRPERPEIIQTLKTAINHYEQRLSVKPGITGLAQVLHKYDASIEDVKKKVQYDLLYVKSRSLLVDLKILARTCLSVTTGRGAH